MTNLVRIDRETLKRALQLLNRWDKEVIPVTVWSEPGADYLLPVETSAFLRQGAGKEILEVLEL